MDCLTVGQELEGLVIDEILVISKFDAQIYPWKSIGVEWAVRMQAIYATEVISGEYVLSINGTPGNWKFIWEHR